MHVTMDAALEVLKEKEHLVQQKEMQIREAEILAAENTRLYEARTREVRNTFSVLSILFTVSSVNLLTFG